MSVPRLAFIAVVALAVLGCVSAQNLGSAKVQGQCNQDFNATLARYYANDQNCSQLIYRAFATTVQSQCPPTVVGSPVHLCMNKNNTGGIADAWAALIVRCDYMYIANRQGAGESETGFTYNSDSCFQPFKSWNDFTNWLFDASPYGGEKKQTQAAGMTHMAVSSLFGALVLALVLLLQ